jgi:hypothetical protein
MQRLFSVFFAQKKTVIAYAAIMYNYAVPHHNVVALKGRIAT